MRRGKKAANIIYGNPATVLVGDFLFSRSFELMTEDGAIQVLRILSNASAVIAEGEVDQLVAQRQVETSEERYLSIINAKTAALFAAACRIAAVVAERSEADELALDAYGRNLGIAFQLADDAIDYDSDASEMGKDQGDDFREGKMTLPVILAYARGSEDERAFWRDAIAGNRNSDEDLATAIALIRKHDAVQATANARVLCPARDRRDRPLPRQRCQGSHGRSRRIRGGPPLLIRSLLIGADLPDRRPF
jgi:octaprenyl-diphosphate synthase